MRTHRYWDLDYPIAGELTKMDENEAREKLTLLLDQAVRRRRQGESQVGVLLSGGLDSALISATLRRADPAARINAYCATFPGEPISEDRYQRAVAHAHRLRRRSVSFDSTNILAGLQEMVWHAECPVRESYNVCSLGLARAIQEDKLKVILSGEGADELFGGYPGYRIDSLCRPGESLLQTDTETNQEPWSTGALRYERDYPKYHAQVQHLYSADVRHALTRRNALSETAMRLEMLRGRAPLHQRSYLDVKLRLGDHLLGDHADRMLYAGGIEARFPFLDLDLVAFVLQLPPELKLRGGVEKYILRQIAAPDVPRPIRLRQKYGFRAVGSDALLSSAGPQFDQLLSSERIRRDGYFDPPSVEWLKKAALEAKRGINPLFEDDYLMIIITFNMLLDNFVNSK